MCWKYSVVCAARCNQMVIYVWGAAWDQLLLHWKGLNQLIHRDKSSGSLSKYFRIWSPLGRMSQLYPSSEWVHSISGKKREEKLLNHRMKLTCTIRRKFTRGPPSRAGLACRLTLNPRCRRVPVREPGSADELGMMDLGKSDAPTPSK